MSSGSSKAWLILMLAAVAGCASQAPVDVVPRAAWGWVDSGDSLPEHTISRITIHHGGVAFDDARDPAEYLRALQAWSRREKEWIDIPYHYVIDLDGRIYEARPIRFPGDTNTSYDPTSHALIEVLGNYDNRELSDAQFEALAKLSAHLATRHSVAVSDIRGHKDYAPGETSCPGTSIYRRLEDGSLLRRVSELMK
jgi:hypothetical protein